MTISVMKIVFILSLENLPRLLPNLLMRRVIDCPTSNLYVWLAVVRAHCLINM